ncbi:hypothetical protein [Paenibacillus sp. yr247]|uniref:hypothetical protein n=1 Tax=Paenibacillus sp. yr247 TaxID=1761880 RepID=UPI001587814E|nr:hypothetical protein [Paenibacillus sp. yr247]
MDATRLESQRSRVAEAVRRDGSTGKLFAISSGGNKYSPASTPRSRTKPRTTLLSAMSF